MFSVSLKNSTLRSATTFNSTLKDLLDDVNRQLGKTWLQFVVVMLFLMNFSASNVRLLFMSVSVVKHVNGLQEWKFLST